jgi:hypothetical protein
VARPEERSMSHIFLVDERPPVEKAARAAANLRGKRMERPWGAADTRPPKGYKGW